MFKGFSLFFTLPVGVLAIGWGMDFFHPPFNKGGPRHKDIILHCEFSCPYKGMSVYIPILPEADLEG